MIVNENHHSDVFKDISQQRSPLWSIFFGHNEKLIKLSLPKNGFTEEEALAHFKEMMAIRNQGYHQGFKAGSEAKQNEIREVLGITTQL